MPNLIGTAQFLGLTTTSFLSGYIACFSIVTVPALAASPPGVKAQNWATAYHIGARTAPLIALSSAAIWGFLARSATVSTIPGVHAAPNAVGLYAGAAGFTLAIVPWTILAMGKTNGDMHEAAEGGVAEGAQGEKQVGELLARWTVLNAVRAGMVGVGALLGGLAIFDFM